ncbi:MAG: YbaK/EbsC family protein [Eubacteriaceae bacterium]|nr:YbaK/EbsC family protein [Eubacteriaceae bacterium]
MQEIFDVLDQLDIKYTLHEHEAVFTVDDVIEKGCIYPGINVKNLLVKDKKSGRLYFVILEDGRRLDFKGFREWTGWGSRMTFAGDDDLMTYLNVTPGSCSLLGLVFDREHALTVVLCREIAEADDDELINFHPNVNTVTVSLKVGDVRRFIDHLGNEVICEI